MVVFTSAGMLLVRLVNEEAAKNPGKNWVTRAVGGKNDWLHARDMRLELSEYATTRRLDLASDAH